MEGVAGWFAVVGMVVELEGKILVLPCVVRVRRVPCSSVMWRDIESGGRRPPP